MLGIDPGTLVTGYACLGAGACGWGDSTILEAGVFRFATSSPLPVRLVELERDLASAVDRLGPAAMVIESLFAHTAHPRTAIIMGHARGVVLLVAARAGLPVIEVPPATVKKAVTGTGRATKAQVQSAVAGLMGLARVPRPADVADAIAVALAGLSRREDGLIPPFRAGRGRRRRASPYT